MRGERDKGIEALMGAYGIGRRLATRVAALRAKMVDVTGAVLAGAAEGGPLERMLLAPGLLADAGALDTQRLQQLAADQGAEEAQLLRLTRDAEAGWATIALEDDLLAEEALANARPGGATGDLGLVRAGPTQISRGETEGLFSPEEVARLKLSVLTSQNADERIEAVRKLVFAPMDGAQKAGILLNVLVDREAEPKVRREAIRSLEQIGFRSDMAEAVRGLFQEDHQEAVYAIQRLGVLLREAEAGEAALVLAVILEVFDQSKDTEMLRELLHLIGRSAGILIGSYHKTEQFLQSALRHVARDFEELRHDTGAAVRACAEQAPELAADLVWRELKRSEDPRVRGLLLNLCEALAGEEGRIGELAELAVAEILNPALPESERARLRYGLVRIGEPAVKVALDRMATATGTARSELIRLVDVVCTESVVSDQTIQTAVASLIDLLKLADAITRRSILEAALPADPRVDGELQQELAGELLTLMSEQKLPGALDAIQTTIERIGAPALRPAFDLVRRSYPAEAAQRAALALGAIVQNDPDAVPDDLAEDVIGLCMGLLHDERVEDGAFTIALAAVCGHTPVGARSFDAALGGLTEELWQLPYAMDALDALGIMAGSTNAGQESQAGLFELFDRIVRFQARSGLGVRKETDEGAVYEFGREIEFDIRAVPAAVKGLERICASPQASDWMRTEIVKRLLVLWEGVSKVRIIWGPAAIDALIHAMCTAACAPGAGADVRARMGESLLRSLNKISVVRSIGQICSQPVSDPGVQELALEACAQLLDEWEAANMQDEERNAALLTSVGRIAANPALDAEADAVRNVREQALVALFRGLREGMTALREPLVLMRDCPGLSADQKQEIDERLGKAFGLVRIGTAR